MIVNKNIYIHLGLHKTASTFFQKSFYPSYQEFNYKPLREEQTLAEFNQYILRENEISFSTEKAFSLFSKNLDLEEINTKRITLCEEQFSGFPLQDAYNRVMVFNRLHQLFPNAKYVLVVRNQKDFIKSMYAEYLKKGGTASLNSFLSTKSTHLNFSRGSYLKYYKYYKFICDKVGKENILILYYEDLVKNHLFFFDNLLNFMNLDLDVHNFNMNKKNNVSATDAYFESIRFYNRIGKTNYSPDHLISPKYKSRIIKTSGLFFKKAPDFDILINNYIKTIEFQNNLLPEFERIRKYGY